MKPLDLPEIPLPKYWTADIKRGLLAAFTLAHYTLVHVRAWGHCTEQLAVRREVEHERHEADAALLREQNRLLKERFSRVESKPHYDRFQRFASRVLRAATLAKVASQTIRKETPPAMVTSATEGLSS